MEAWLILVKMENIIFSYFIDTSYYIKVRIFQYMRSFALCQMYICVLMKHHKYKAARGGVTHANSKHIRYMHAPRSENISRVAKASALRTSMSDTNTRLSSFLPTRTLSANTHDTIAQAKP